MEVLNRFKPYIRILRPEIADMDFALPAATVLLATYFAYPDTIHSFGRFPDPFAFILAVIGGYFAITSSYVFNDYCDVDIAIVMDHLILQAADLGLGTCWVAAFDPAAAREVLQLSREWEPIAFTPLGYPADSPRPKARMPLDDLVIRLP